MFRADASRRTWPLPRNLYQGMTLDAVTGLYDGRARDYSPSLGRWMEQGPAQFINGADTYQFVNSSPVGNVDSAGTEVTIKGSLSHGTITFKTGFNLEIFHIELGGAELRGKGSYSVAKTSHGHPNPSFGKPSFSGSGSFHLLPPSGNFKISVSDGPLKGSEELSYSFPQWDVMQVTLEGELSFVYYFNIDKCHHFKLEADLNIETKERASGLIAVAAYAVATVAPEADVAVAGATDAALTVETVEDVGDAVVIKLEPYLVAAARAAA